MAEVRSAATAPRIPAGPGLDARRLHSTAHVEVIEIALGAGERLARHASPVDTFFYVLAGNGTLEADSGNVPLSAGTLVPNPARTMHRVTNDSAAPLRFLVVKTPKPDSPPVFDDNDD